MLSAWIRTFFRELQALVDRQPGLGWLLLVAASAALAFTVYEFGKDAGAWVYGIANGR